MLSLLLTSKALRESGIVSFRDIGGEEDLLAIIRWPYGSSEAAESIMCLEQMLGSNRLYSLLRNQLSASAGSEVACRNTVSFY